MCSCSSSADTPCAVSCPPIQSVSSSRQTVRPPRAAASPAAIPPAPPPTTSTSHARSSTPRLGSVHSTTAVAGSPVARTAITSRRAVTAASRAQVELADHIGPLELGGRSAERDVAGLEEIGAVGQLESHGRVLLDEHDGEAAPRQLADDARDLAHDDGREPQRRLVEEQALGLRHEPAPDGQHLLLASRERAAALLDALAQPREELVDVFEVAVDVAAIRPLVGAHPQVVQHRAPPEELAPLGHEHEAALDALERQEPRDVFAEIADVTGRGLLESRDDPQRRGLAGGVRADDADDLAAFHLETHVVQDVDLGVAAIDPVKLEHVPLPASHPGTLRSPPSR